ncbi:hypothetical protein CEQ90_01825 [Lewinellaceae bacterium SD302]|nr:hypothetical protein CEQ90_01825 [Lewinellaceae bacterium SD302]
MSKETTTWPDLAIGLYEKLTGRGAEISYEFDNFELHVPRSTDSDMNTDNMAPWKMNGTLRITTRDKQKGDKANG